MMTYREFLENNHKLASDLKKEKEALKLLFVELKHLSNVSFYDELNKEVSIDEQKKIQELFNKYLYDNIPVQYILGYTYFYGLKFKVTKDVLIPRFDTEVLVENVLKRSFNGAFVVDIGTGSGCIAIALKKNNSSLNIDAIDISKEALNVAIENAKLNNVNIDFIQNDSLFGIEKKYDIVVSNPPYIAKNDEVDNLVYKNEPHLALFSEDDGMYFYDKILSQSLNNLKKGGIIFFEIGYNQKEKIEKIVKKYYPLANVKVIKDYNNNDRLAIIDNCN